MIFSKKYNWISSKNPAALPSLLELEQKMNSFYSNEFTREHYQEMIDLEPTFEEMDDHSVRKLLLKRIKNISPKNMLEIGCGSGRTYNNLVAQNYKGSYSGIDVPPEVIDSNKNNYPEAEWMQGSIYNLPFPSQTFELTFSMYVLEHLVFPEKGIKEMIRVTKPGGRILLVFPDFVEAGRFASQLIGFSPGTTSSKLKSYKFFDSFISFFENRFLLPKKLKKVSGKLEFPINLNPICLSFPDAMSPDVDAVYISSKSEVASWFIENGYPCVFPFGTSGELKDQAFLEVTV